MPLKTFQRCVARRRGNFSVKHFTWVDQFRTMAFTQLSYRFLLPAITMDQLYKQRWQVELFFRWIKQNLRIENFCGTSENAVKTQIGIAFSVYLIVAIIRKRLNLQESLYTILQALSVSLFEKTAIFPLFTLYDDPGTADKKP